MFYPNISPRSPKQEGVRFAGAPVLSSSKGEYWKVDDASDDEDGDHTKSRNGGDCNGSVGALLPEV